ncbi:MAG: ATP-dependent protease, partial [Proteobacteria bacterium]|nr:ATP-dependent protease [Pseudomonadota bacterium]MBU1611466.1 ATP-dependent protease [Pseudomonadota bacterium]
MGFFKKSEETKTETARDASALGKLQRRVDEAGLPTYVLKAARAALEQLEKTDPSAAEHGIGMNYTELLLALPWDKATEDNLDLSRAESILNQEHYGLMSVKERILEHLASSIVRRQRTFRILVVDDEPIACDNIAHALRRESYEVLIACNGQEAKERFAETEIDLV